MSPVDEKDLCGVEDPEDKAEEARKPRIFKRPDAPTKQELEEHLPTHLSDRSWCPVCTAGRGISRRYAAPGGDKEKLGVTINIDYCFMIPVEAEQDTCPILIMYDDNL